MVKKIAVIGAGSMGSAIAIGLSNDETLDIHIMNRSSGKLEGLKKLLDFKAFTDLSLLLKEDLDLILLAVKPKDFKDLLSQIKEHGINEKALLISVAAGIEISTIQKFFPENPIARAMPNTPCQIKAGVTAVSCNEKAEPFKCVLRRIFENLGELVFVNDDQMHIVTAVSGSGPAYFFKFIEAMVEAAKQNGLDEENAEKLAVETMYGAALLLKKSQDSAASLREKVTSPNGTTYAALQNFEKSSIDSVVSEAIKAAAERSKEIAAELAA